MTEAESTKSTTTTRPTSGEPGAGADRTPNAVSTAGGYLRDVVTLPLDGLRRVAPDSPVPVALAAGALAVGGIIEWPVAGAIGLGYLALRRWR